MNNLGQHQWPLNGDHHIWCMKSTTRLRKSLENLHQLRSTSANIDTIDLDAHDKSCTYIDLICVHLWIRQIWHDVWQKVIVCTHSQIVHQKFEYISNNYHRSDFMYLDALLHSVSSLLPADDCREHRKISRQQQIRKCVRDAFAHSWCIYMRDARSLKSLNKRSQ